MADPVVLSAIQKGTSVKSLCANISTQMLRDFNYALVWGTSAKHLPQRCGLMHSLDNDCTRDGELPGITWEDSYVTTRTDLGALKSPPENETDVRKATLETPAGVRKATPRNPNRCAQSNTDEPSRRVQSDAEKPQLVCATRH